MAAINQVSCFMCSSYSSSSSSSRRDVSRASFQFPKIHTNSLISTTNMQKIQPNIGLVEEMDFGRISPKNHNKNPKVSPDVLEKLYVILEAVSDRRRPCATAPLAHPSETLLFRRFWWLEYSDEKDAAFCFPCYLFGRKHIGRAGSDTFIAKGFNNWRKVNSGTACPFVNQEGKAPTSAHNFFVRCYEDLKNKVCHIENVIDKQTEQEIMDMMRLSLYFNKKFYNSLLSAPNRCSIVKARHEGCYHSLGE
nr:hypothetical protein [Tanacetum cinerariifolium]